MKTHLAKYLVWIVLLLVPFSLANCRGKKDSGTTEKQVVEKVLLSIESWRNDDITMWEDTIIPAFNKQYPDIEVRFNPSPPAEYNSVLNTKLAGGTAGDLITARPFDQSLDLFNKGFLVLLNDLAGMNNFSAVAKSAWTTDDGSTVFAVPMASVIHGFMYNKDIFAELNLQVPTTEAEFYRVLDAIKADGRYIPLDIGTKDLWEVATMGYQNIGPNYWKGEEGRQALIKGTAKLTDPEFVKPLEQLNRWRPYLNKGFEAQTYVDSQQLFTLGKAAIYPTGSWEIGVFTPQIDFEMGAFPPYLPQEGDTLYISDHTDIAMGLNASSAHPQEARKFLEWMTTQEFANLYSNGLPGFFTLSNHDVTLTDPVSQEFISWRSKGESTIRNSYQILSRGEPNLENEIWRVSAAAMTGTMTPQNAAKELQDGLESWYKPQ